MAVLEVLKFPDPKLRRKAVEVDAVTPELAQFADDMLETMYEFRGIGLAATQVGDLNRLLVIDTRPREDGRYSQEGLTELEKQVTQPIQIFNPRITKKEGDTTFAEGCLSVPGYYEEVKRFEYIEVEGLNTQGQPISIKTDGLLSICLQHEIDHLDGKLFIDRLSVVKSNRIKSKIKKFGYEDTQSEDSEEDLEDGR